MKSLSIYKRHPVVYFDIIAVLGAAQIKRACLVGDRPCTTVGLSAFGRSTAYDVGFCHERTVLVKPQMLVIQADFYVTARQVVGSVALHSLNAVYRISGNCGAAL